MLVGLAALVVVAVVDVTTSSRPRWLFPLGLAAVVVAEWLRRSADRSRSIWWCSAAAALVALVAGLLLATEKGGNGVDIVTGLVLAVAGIGQVVVLFVHSSLRRRLRT